MALPATPNPFTFARQALSPLLVAVAPAAARHHDADAAQCLHPAHPARLHAGATLLVLLVASINYQLNLGYLLTFLLAGSAVVGMHLCHGTLRGLTHAADRPSPIHGGQRHLWHQPGQRRRTAPATALAWRAGRHHPDHWSWTDVPAQGPATVQVAFRPRAARPATPAATDGRDALSPGHLPGLDRLAPGRASAGLSRARSHGPPPLPPGEPRSGAASARSQSTGEFDGVRGLPAGRPAQAGGLEAGRQARPAVPTSWSAATPSRPSATSCGWTFSHTGRAGSGSRPPPHRLSRLCAWVLQADKLGLDYGCACPAEIKPASGEAHKRRCLEALACCADMPPLQRHAGQRHCHATGATRCSCWW
jgi:hypothetical protein